MASNSHPSPRAHSILRLRQLFFAAVLFAASPAFAADESCHTCGGAVSVSGDFAHHKSETTPAFSESGFKPEAYREEVHGTAFTVTIANLPAGRYTVEIGAAETFFKAPGETVFDVHAGDVVLAKDFDLIATAGAPHVVTTIRGTVEKPDDALRGPMRLTFTASKGHAKFNTITVRDASGAAVVAFAANELADAYSAQASQIPEIKEPAIWRDPSKPLRARADDLIRRMSLAEKVAQLKNAAPAIERLGLPAYDYWNEAAHGVANNYYATVFPGGVGAAASWNPALFHQEGQIIGIEGRAKFNDYANRNNGNSKWWAGLTYWAPNVNIFRDPRWGRGQETFGEDPFLTSEIAIQFVRGMQGDDPKYMTAMACAKHYAVHSGPELDRHRFNAVVTERDLYDTYLPQFERLVREAKVAGVMSAYNAIDGVPVSANPFFLTELVRKRWGFEGYIVSDCDAIRDIYNPQQHAYVKTAEEAASLAVKAGCNLCCGGDYNALVRAVQQGLITEKEIDQALYHTLWTRFRLGLFDPADQVPFSKYTLADNDLPEHGRVALDLARQSLVLLKNDGILPLDRSKYKQVAVIGPNAASTSMFEGNYHGSASHPISILDGIRHVAAAEFKVLHAMGSPITTKTEIAPWSGQDNTTTRPVAELKAEALAVAAQADLIIYVGGITAAQEGESFDRTEIELPPEQSDLIKALHATGKPVVMINCSGSAMALPWEDEHLSAIIQAWYPGQAGGRAVADVLFGFVNPSGHLPVTFYRSTADLPDFTDYSMRNRTYRYFTGKPLYAFGHGLSYTTFEYSDLRVARAAEGALTVTVEVANTGARDGDDVVQLYATPPAASQPQEIRALCGFTRVSLKAGEKRTVTITVPAIALRRWSVAKKDYEIPAGEWAIAAGASSADLRQTTKIKL
ncbi:MAG TPA: glycoside hydrolase family 3 C-terminal domain-containing protein [Opitutaceae bacterium]|nr:glycoside hydrolase family 3 C-terminal domain-containing protein [Opitutaceae bacterium]HOR25560.1 glycoside hydrolase family 3 C-terminal domain-containing protein [Opitutaceae bacterium]HPK49878.1 glycoside hydrolase family 3 C-terminal domain-containing protein [Opitutaceae bacterium]